MCSARGPVHAVGESVRPGPCRTLDHRDNLHLHGHRHIHPQDRDADREGVGPRTQLHAVRRLPNLLPTHVRAASQAESGYLRYPKIRSRFRIRRHLLISTHENKPNFANIRQRATLGETAGLHQSSIAGGHRVDAHLGAGHRCNRLVGARSSARQTESPVREERRDRAQVWTAGPVVHAFTHLQHVPHPRLHALRDQDEENPRELQRIQVHRLRHVHHLHHLARFRSHLFRNAELFSGEIQVYNNYCSLDHHPYTC